MGPCAWVWSDDFLDPGELRSEGQDHWSAERTRAIRDAIQGAGVPLLKM
jgi:hypothetical protein